MNLPDRDESVKFLLRLLDLGDCLKCFAKIEEIRREWLALSNGGEKTWRRLADIALAVSELEAHGSQPIKDLVHLLRGGHIIMPPKKHSSTRESDQSKAEGVKK